MRLSSRHLKEVFPRFGILEIVRADNVITSSPYYHQSDGGVESSVKVAKQLLKKNDHISSTHVEYQTTPLENEFSPNALLMNRHLRPTLPLLPSKLSQQVEHKRMQQKENSKTSLQADRYNKQHRVRQLEDLKGGEVVWISDLLEYGIIEQIGPEPRFYIVHNRWFLVLAPYNDGKVVVNRGLCNPDVNKRETPAEVNREESDEFEMDKGTESTEIGTCGYTLSRKGTLQTVIRRSDRQGHPRFLPVGNVADVSGQLVFLRNSPFSLPLHSLLMVPFHVTMARDNRMEVTLKHRLRFLQNGGVPSRAEIYKQIGPELANCVFKSLHGEEKIFHQMIPRVEEKQCNTIICMCTYCVGPSSPTLDVVEVVLWGKRGSAWGEGLAVEEGTSTASYHPLRVWPSSRSNPVPFLGNLGGNAHYPNPLLILPNRIHSFGENVLRTDSLLSCLLQAYCLCSIPLIPHTTNPALEYHCPGIWMANYLDQWWYTSPLGDSRECTTDWAASRWHSTMIYR
ncbi:hypothetical protein PR048_029982 [Dryococelus australis]|uniref:RRM domain-containing protein n=1 Tax=Dryococelus australis TaxID=614101 RepID=A0ABQ9GBI4_9NEOP|nr:hypothetical protein PR048_029982 [Dryococelus australis]